MAQLQDYDGLLLAFNNKFLTNLIGEKYKLSKIRFKFLSINRNPMYRTFATYEDFVKFFASILNDPQRSCMSGKFAVLESIELVNEKLNFPNSYYARTITTNVQVQKNFKFDSYRSKFNDSQVELYQKYLNRKFNNYITDVSTLTTFRKQQYIQSCWIDPDYFVGDLIQLLTV